MRADETGQGDLSRLEPSWASNISEDISIYKCKYNKRGCVRLNTKTTGFSDFKAAALTLARSEARGKRSSFALETALQCGQCCSRSNTYPFLNGRVALQKGKSKKSVVFFTQSHGFFVADPSNYQSPIQVGTQIQNTHINEIVPSSLPRFHPKNITCLTFAF